jgi:hypothetical protein
MSMSKREPSKMIAKSFEPNVLLHRLGRFASLMVRVAGMTAAAATPAAALTTTEVFQPSAKGSPVVVDHRVWDQQLRTYVRPDPNAFNQVDYAGWKARGHGDLKAYVAYLQTVDPVKLDRPEQFAFWANLYNSKTIDIVLDNYPLRSIRDVRLGGGLKAIVAGGPWQAKVVKVAGQDLSLDDIENQIMRPIFKDPRVHYSINCASNGCPNLMAEAFTGAKLYSQLDMCARDFVNHPRALRFENGKLKASNIYSWFQADFGGTPEAVLAHVKTYAKPELRAKLDAVSSIADYDYDWNLNGVAR